MSESLEKSASAFRTIGEVAAELNLPPHVLRFWESKFSQIKPQKRRGGHRYYRPADINIIREIRTLLYDKGFTIKGAQKYLRNNVPAESSPPPAKAATAANVVASLVPATSTARTSQNAPSGIDQGLILKELKAIQQLLKEAS